jgi:hypothetical protein
MLLGAFAEKEKTLPAKIPQTKGNKREEIKTWQDISAERFR